MLRAEGLSFSYRAGGSPVVEALSAQFPKGSMVALTGASGRGKSTLLYIFGLLLRPDQGKLWLDDASLTELSNREQAKLRARRYGFVFQDASLDATRTVLDNITETAVYRSEPRGALTEQAGALLGRLGVDVPLDRRPGEISGGQAQRIALCRAILHKPDVLLADEPTGNLDAASAAVVLDALTEHAEAGGIVIIATHDDRVVSRCSEVVQL